MESSKLHVAIFSSPARGQAIPALVLSNRLATAFNVKVTVLVTTTAEECEFLRSLSLSKHVDIIGLPLLEISPTAGPATRLCIHAREGLPSVRSTISSMDSPPDALIFDMFSLLAMPVARELGIPAYLFITTNAWATAWFMYGCVVDKAVEGPFLDLKEPVNIPGCKPIRPEDMATLMYYRNAQDYHDYMQLSIGANKADGVLINSWEDLEPTTLEALRENDIWRSLVKMPFYPVGPMIRKNEPGRMDSGIQEWLDRQPDESVIYISFGSGGLLSSHQTNELAHGLEMSQQRFVWVVRPPVDAHGLHPPESLDFLPDGFLDRTRDAGFVVKNWASQVEILGHPAVGGFLTHCGWNSVSESICAGVPMIAWPLYAEQKQNTTMLVEEIGVAIRPEVSETENVVGREEIEHLVRRLMQRQEGHEMREKTKKLKFSAENALSNGASSNSLSKFVQEIKSLSFK